MLTDSLMWHSKEMQPFNVAEKNCVLSLKLVGPAVFNPDPSLLTECYLMRMWKQLLPF